MDNIRSDFPILNTQVNGHPLIYLDNAATMQMPLAVQDRMQTFYQRQNSNIHRGIHVLSEESTAEYERTREIVRKFLGATAEDAIIFTAGTTDSVNLVAELMRDRFQPGDEILTTQMEHHSNFIPWQQLCKRLGLNLRVAQVTSEGQIDLEHFSSLCHSNTKLVAFTQLSNVTGMETPVEEMVHMVRQKTPAHILLDGAQGVVHSRKALSSLDCDFYCFSGHKLGAPTGTGVLYVKSRLFPSLQPIRFGGGTVLSVQEDQVTFLQGPSAFEPGTPNYAGVIGLGAALEYWEKHHSVMPHTELLLKRLEAGLLEINGLQVLGQTHQRKGCVSIVLDGIHPFDFCKFLDLRGIAVRSGHLCAMPYLTALHTQHALRFSVAPYNTLEEVEQTLHHCKDILNRLRRYSPLR